MRPTSTPPAGPEAEPLYEDKELAYCKTHYYGGIKKYQWGAIPLALHGVVCKKDGTTVTVALGETPRTRCSASPTCCPTWPRSRCSAR